MIARHQRNARLFHQLLGLGLQAHGLDGRRRRADEDQPRISAGLCKLFVLRQETVARMHRLCTRGLGGLDDALPAQIAVLGCAAADMHGLIARRHMLGMRIRVGIHRHRLHAHAAGCSGNAAGDFASIGDQDFLEHSALLHRCEIANTLRVSHAIC
ncbi:hypothetical protein SDC9_145977 [bioreactor metagenome]|uniref:Uncharacterized protein n=1 Tax=bioreactor metagenome TaxID=1076179 RepID=A0A645EA23_9ZZZZ